ncbi:type 1 fimbrial major subunit FimA [Kosakonia sp. H02]|nr:type 1 fimbrial major subunit FimA [Kosakonia sp. H02]
MNNKLTVISIATGLLLVTGATQAADPVTPPMSVSGGNIHFEGELVHAACALSMRSSTQTVTLGYYRTSSFSKIGDTTPSVPFSLMVNECDHSVASTASVAFSGRADARDSSLLSLSSGSNGASATGVGIEILDTTSKPLKPDGASFSAAQSLVGGSNTLRFSARYKATAAVATAGQANADATFIMKYE